MSDNEVAVPDPGHTCTSGHNDEASNDATAKEALKVLSLSYYGRLAPTPERLDAWLNLCIGRGFTVDSFPDALTFWMQVRDFDWNSGADQPQPTAAAPGVSSLPGGTALTSFSSVVHTPPRFKTNLLRPPTAYDDAGLFDEIVEHGFEQTSDPSHASIQTLGILMNNVQRDYLNQVRVCSMLMFDVSCYCFYDERF